MTRNKLLEQINEIHTSEILGVNQGCKICGENNADMDFLKSSKSLKSSKLSKQYKSYKLSNMIIIILLVVMSIIFANNILITKYFIIDSKEIVNLLSDKFSAAKDYFINKNV